MNHQESRRLMVIGATAGPDVDQLPLYLDPVCVDPDDPSRCYIANVAPWDGSSPRLSYIPQERFEEECDQGYWQRLEKHEPFAWDHRLLALDPDQPPCYLPDEQAYAEVERRGKEALASVADDIKRGAPTTRTRERIWYAARALGDDPLPLLTAIALERDELPPETLDDLTDEVPPPTENPSPLIQYAYDQGWLGLIALIAQDPLGHRYIDDRNDAFAQRKPKYLDRYRDNNSYLRDCRAMFGSGYAHAA